MTEQEIKDTLENFQDHYAFVQANDGIQTYINKLIEKNKTTTQSIKIQLEIAYTAGLSSSKRFEKDFEEFKRYRDNIN